MLKGMTEAAPIPIISQAMLEQNSETCSCIAEYSTSGWKSFRPLVVKADNEMTSYDRLVIRSANPLSCSQLHRRCVRSNDSQVTGLGDCSGARLHTQFEIDRGE
jgi:hypothetical protein